jgi:hypothetical protein
MSIETSRPAELAVVVDDEIVLDISGNCPRKGAQRL